MKRLVLGLAGGVGSGKSTVAALFRKWGARVVDADAIGHRVLDRPAVQARLERFWGPGILREGKVDRGALARAVFRSRRSVERLNRWVHPAILREIRRQIRQAFAPRKGAAAARRRVPVWVVLDAALLFEAGADSLCDRVVFISVPRNVRVRRTAARGWTPDEVRKRERFQWPSAYKEKKADYVINNAGPKSRTVEQARKIYDDLRSLIQPFPP